MHLDQSALGILRKAEDKMRSEIHGLADTVYGSARAYHGL